jgi:hypothetical protein
VRFHPAHLRPIFAFLVERLAHDPAFRLIRSDKIWDRGAALTFRLQSFETEMLAEEGKLRRAGLSPMSTVTMRCPARVPVPPQVRELHHI